MKKKINEPYYRFASTISILATIVFLLSIAGIGNPELLKKSIYNVALGLISFISFLISLYKFVELVWNNRRNYDKSTIIIFSISLLIIILTVWATIYYQWIDYSKLWFDVKTGSIMSLIYYNFFSATSFAISTIIWTSDIKFRNKTE